MASRTRKLRVEGLDCARCAIDIEKALKRAGFRQAIVNFATGEVIIDGDVKKAAKIIRDVKPDLRVIAESGPENEERGHSHESNEHDEHDEDAMKRLYYIIPALILFTIGMILKYYYYMEGDLLHILLISSYLLAGWRVLKNAVINPIHGRFFDENTLITIATLGAFAIHEIPEAVGVMLFYVVGELLQDLAVGKSRRSIKALLKLKADYANLVINGRIVRVKPEQLKPGDVIVVRPGEKIPVDGIVIEGSSSVDASALTGESIPRDVDVGSEVLSGMVNLSGVIKVKVTKELRESTVSKILELIEKASARKARTEKFITRFSQYYVPAVVTLAAGIAAIPPLLFGEPFYDWVYRALVLLVISCPCALVLSIPLGYFAGIGKCARSGILVKGSNFIDALSDVKIVALDKTGTLTKGVFKVTHVEAVNGFTEEEVLKYAAIAEAHSNHPIAQAIREAYGMDIATLNVKYYEEIAGHGVKAIIDSTEILAGNDKLLHKYMVKHDPEVCDIKGTVVHVVINGRYARYIVVSDEIKEDAPEAIRSLKRLGIKKIVMVTGDSEYIARKVAKELGIDEYYAELLPEDKVRVIEKLKESLAGRGKVAFAGDGINDAPVIARADVGIAMGALGSDAAIETADVVIMDDKPSKIPRGIMIARKTKRIILQNIILAIGVKLAMIVLGVAGMATMWEAVFADVGVAIIAVLNSMRILR
ncbi:MAG: heavy metal translocating P-type ATPase [Thermoprotei archaeon]